MYLTVKSNMKSSCILECSKIPNTSYLTKNGLDKLCRPSGSSLDTIRTVSLLTDISKRKVFERLVICFKGTFAVLYKFGST